MTWKEFATKTQRHKVEYSGALVSLRLRGNFINLHFSKTNIAFFDIKVLFSFIDFDVDVKSFFWLALITSLNGHNLWP